MIVMWPNVEKTSRTYEKDRLDCIRSALQSAQVI